MEHVQYFLDYCREAMLSCRDHCTEVEDLVVGAGV